MSHPSVGLQIAVLCQNHYLNHPKRQGRVSEQLDERLQVQTVLCPVDENVVQRLVASWAAEPHLTMGHVSN